MNRGVLFKKCANEGLVQTNCLSEKHFSMLCVMMLLIIFGYVKELLRSTIFIDWRWHCAFESQTIAYQRLFTITSNTRA